MTEIFEQVAAVSEQMIQFNLHKDEFLLLQATVLVNAGELTFQFYQFLLLQAIVLVNAGELTFQFNIHNFRRISVTTGDSVS